MIIHLHTRCFRFANKSIFGPYEFDEYFAHMFFIVQVKIIFFSWLLSDFKRRDFHTNIIYIYIVVRNQYIS